MSKHISTLFISLLFFFFASAQNDKNALIETKNNTLGDSNVVVQLYKYNHFPVGQVFFRDGKISEGRINYNLYLEVMEFISPKGDTLTIDDIENIRYVAIEKDTFYFDNGFHQLIKGDGQVKIGMHEKLRIADHQKGGAYNQNYDRSSIRSFNSITLSNQKMALSINDKYSLSKEVSFSIADKFYNFSPLSKKIISKKYSNKKIQLEEYLTKNQVDFGKKDDVIKLANFLETL